jgi:hypothetical protein
MVYNVAGRSAGTGAATRPNHAGLGDASLRSALKARSGSKAVSSTEIKNVSYDPTTGHAAQASKRVLKSSRIISGAPITSNGYNSHYRMSSLGVST